jgi:hypothetical protein
MIVHIQNSLRAGASLAALQAPPYSLIVRRHVRFPNLVLFKYDQLNSLMDSPLVCQCRGLILDEANDWAVVSRPFDKFWNAGEGRAAEIDWHTATVQEKLDGSLMQLYHYAGQWHVGTSGTPDASGDVGGFGFTFEELFWRVWRENAMVLPPMLLSDYTFLFELCTPYNKVVVQHRENRLVLLSTRNRLTGVEVRTVDVYPMVRSFPLGSMAEALATFDTMQPLEQEGYVIVDAQNRRVKVKHPGYVALHHMRDSFSPRAFVEVVRKGEVDEVITAFPEFGPRLRALRTEFDLLVQDILFAFEELSRDNLSQKEFALRAVKMPWSGILFGLRKRQWATVQQALQDVQVDKVASWLGVGTDVALTGL